MEKFYGDVTAYKVSDLRITSRRVQKADESQLSILVRVLSFQTQSPSRPSYISLYLFSYRCNVSHCRTHNLKCDFTLVGLCSRFWPILEAQSSFRLPVRHHPMRVIRGMALYTRQNWSSLNRRVEPSQSFLL